MNSCIFLLRKFKVLGQGFKYVLANNPSNYAPYHNLNHMLNVMVRCNYLAEKIGNFDTNIEDLLVAALFHDTDHSMGFEKDDTKNVERSIKFFHTFIEKEEPNINWYSVEKIIEKTKYPYESGELSLKEKIIRDADLLGFIEENRFLNIIIGLSKEMNKPVKDVIKLQIDWLKILTFQLSQTTEMFNNKKKYWIDELKEYQKILK